MNSKNHMNNNYVMKMNNGDKLMILGGSERQSVLESFTQGEVNEMMSWLAAREQNGDGALIDHWPGWQQVGERMQHDIGQAGEITRALLARIRAARNL